MNVKFILSETDVTIKNREDAAEHLFKFPEHLDETIKIITKPQDLSTKALLVIEMFSRKHFQALKDYLPDLINSGKLYSDSASRRCLAKIFNLALKSHFDSENKLYLKPQLRKEILELSFSWLVSKEKTAVKVFSMQNIFDLRQEESWIALELKGILEKEIINSSAGYKSRAAKILRKL